MTPLKHAQYLGLGHFGFAGLAVVGSLVMGLMGIAILRNTEVEWIEAELPPAVIAYFFIFAAGLSVFATIPSVFAGYAFLKRRAWAKVAGIIAAVSISMSFPLGTLIAAYTLWFLFSEAGKQLYDGITPLERPLPPPPPKEGMTLNHA